MTNLYKRIVLFIKNLYSKQTHWYIAGDAEKYYRNPKDPVVSKIKLVYVAVKKSEHTESSFYTINIKDGEKDSQLFCRVE